MPEQYVPQITLLTIMQNAYNAGKKTYGGRRGAVGLNRFYPERPVLPPTAESVANAPRSPHALASTEFAVQHDYALRNSGIDPNTTTRGSPLVTYGGHTFVNYDRSGEKFTGNLEEYSATLNKYIRGRDELNRRNLAAQATGQIDQRVSFGNEREVTAQYGSFGQKERDDLYQQFGQLTGEQRDQLIAQTGLTVDRLQQYQNEGGAFKTHLQQQTEITGRPDFNAPSLGESVLSQTIQNRQAAQGIFQSNASAAAEGAALGAFKTAKAANSAGTVLAGLLDPNKLQHTGYAPISDNSYRRRGGTISYDEANPLRYLENPTVAANCGIGSGGSFGA